ncbi:MAG: NUDIX domain-containing protein [Candidatus Woesearchaeota archaeon]
MPASRISIEHAKKDKLFYFVANVVIYREDGKCLILRRSETEKVHPGKYALPGGKLEWKDLNIENPARRDGEVLAFDDAVEELLVREAKEESGVDIDKHLKYVSNVVFVRPDGIPVVMVLFAAKYLGCEVVLEEGCFTDYAWVDAEEVKKQDCISGVPEQVKMAIELMKKQSA